MCQLLMRFVCLLQLTKLCLSAGPEPADDHQVPRVTHNLYFPRDTNGNPGHLNDRDIIISYTICDRRGPLSIDVSGTRFTPLSGHWSSDPRYSNVEALYVPATSGTCESVIVRVKPSGEPLTVAVRFGQRSYPAVPYSFPLAPPSPPPPPPSRPPPPPPTPPSPRRTSTFLPESQVDNSKSYKIALPIVVIVATLLLLVVIIIGAIYCFLRRSNSKIEGGNTDGGDV